MAVQHMVWIRFKPGISAQRVAQHIDGLRAMVGKVPQIRKLCVGENFTNRSEGFTHGLLVELADRQALTDYMQHPDHLAVAKPLDEDADLRALDIEE